MNGTACYCEGVVESVHEEGHLLVKTPCAVIRGGQMPGNTSGGPVVDAANNIIGVVSASGADETSTVVSYWSAILPQPQSDGLFGLQVSDIAIKLGLLG